jgi:hypothetical protein
LTSQRCRGSTDKFPIKMNATTRNRYGSEVYITSRVFSSVSHEFLLRAFPEKMSSDNEPYSCD